MNKRPIFTLKLKDNEGKTFDKSFTLYSFDYKDSKEVMLMLEKILPHLTEVQSRKDGMFQMKDLVECSIRECEPQEFLLF